jgi:hypothetical protein
MTTCKRTETDEHGKVWPLPHRVVREVYVVRASARGRDYRGREIPITRGRECYACVLESLASWEVPLARVNGNTINIDDRGRSGFGRWDAVTDGHHSMDRRGHVEALAQRGIDEAKARNVEIVVEDDPALTWRRLFHNALIAATETPEVRPPVNDDETARDLAHLCIGRTWREVDEVVEKITRHSGIDDVCDAFDEAGIGAMWSATWQEDRFVDGAWTLVDVEGRHYLQRSGDALRVETVVQQPALVGSFGVTVGDGATILREWWPVADASGFVEGMAVDIPAVGAKGTASAFRVTGVTPDGAVFTQKGRQVGYSTAQNIVDAAGALDTNKIRAMVDRVRMHTNERPQIVMSPATRDKLVAQEEERARRDHAAGRGPGPKWETETPFDIMREMDRMGAEMGRHLAQTMFWSGPPTPTDDEVMAMGMQLMGTPVVVNAALKDDEIVVVPQTRKRPKGRP